MKIRVTQEFDLPDEVYNKKSHFPAATQNIFDDVINYARMQHVIDEMSWTIKTNHPNHEFHANHHKTWQKIIEKSMETVKYEII